MCDFFASDKCVDQIGRLFVEDHFKPLDEPEEVLANPQPVPRPSSIHLLTQNIWGLPHAFDQRRRMAGLCELLSSGQYDIICFQEVARVHDVARFVYVRLHVGWGRRNSHRGVCVHRGVRTGCGAGTTTRACCSTAGTRTPRASAPASGSRR